MMQAEEAFGAGMQAAPAHAAGRDFGVVRPRLFDMHCHLDFFADPALVAAQARELGLGILAVGVEPASYGALAQRLDQSPALRLAVGAHPWWMAAEGTPRADLALACETAAHCRFIGEVGLDFSARTSLQGRQAQVDAFAQIAETCARVGGRVLSIHAVRSAGPALDILEAAGALKNCTCILHWFSGSSQELWRAIRAGAWFSVGERQLATRRGREYARLIPADRLLLESDLPAPDGSGAADAADLVASLEGALALLGQCRGQGAQELAAILAANSAGLLERPERSRG